ncbi:hypothetical protein C2G38_2118786, partial [Gigaspora rosea]
NKTTLENNHKSRNGNSVISRIIKQQTQIFLREIVYYLRLKEKKIFNDTASESSSESGPGSESFYDNEDFTIDMEKYDYQMNDVDILQQLYKRGLYS